MTTPTETLAVGVTSANDLTPTAVERRFLSRAWEAIESVGYGRLDYALEVVLARATIYGSMIDARRTGC